MDQTTKPYRLSCTALTRLGRPCRRLAREGSKPPRCGLHSPLPRPTSGAVRELQQTSLYFAKIGSDKHPPDQDNRNLQRELDLARHVLGMLVNQLQDPEIDTVGVRQLVPLIYRGIKLISDLVKQLDARGEESSWDAVLNRLAQELQADI